MKLLKVIISVVFGRLIHVGLKSFFPPITNDPDTAFLLGAVLGGGSLLLGFAIVYGLANFWEKRQPKSQSNESVPTSIPAPKTTLAEPKIPPNEASGVRSKSSTSVAITVAAVIVGGAIGPALVKSFSTRVPPHKFDRTLVEMSDRINATLPRQVDKDTRLDTTIAGPGNRLTYLYTLPALSTEDVDSMEFSKIMRPVLVNGYRTNPDMATFRNNQVELHYQYRDKSGGTIATIMVSPRDF
jgi:hypothetical protein